MTQDTKQEIEDLLHAKLTISHLDVIDESALHIGHPGAKRGGGHYRVKISAKELNTLPLLQQHRLINNALADLFQYKIHALAIEVIATDQKS